MTTHGGERSRRRRRVHDALARGVALRGFVHWTGVDNDEWLLGYDVAFGPFDGQRKARPSARVRRAATLTT